MPNWKRIFTSPITAAVENVNGATFVEPTGTNLAHTGFVGFKVVGTAGENIVGGMPVYYNANDEEWFKAKADDEDTCFGILGVAPITILSGNTGDIILLGYYRHDTLLDSDVGSVYLNDAGFGCVTSPPTSVDTTSVVVCPKLSAKAFSPASPYPIKSPAVL